MNLIAVFLITALFGFTSDPVTLESLSEDTNPSCSQISSNKFYVQSSDKNGCLLWGYINANGEVHIDVETFESDTKVYAWWTQGQFLLKSELILLSEKTSLPFPKTRNARLHVKAECGSAIIKIKSDLR